jgi:diguanylate cyclase (GGDEF)-like protein/PAS domain S-box-containing protein
VRDLQHRILTWNHGCERVYGWSAEEVVGKSLFDLVRGNPQALLERHETLLRDGSWTGEAIHHRRDGTAIQVESRWTLVRDEQGRPESVLSINTDITRRKAAEEAVHKLAFFDPLTGLPNRQSFNAALARVRGDAARSGKAGALLFVNLDKFKFVNETLGHAEGDILLKQAGGRLSFAVSESDTVAHIGADEFLVLLTPVHADIEAARAHAGDISQRIVETFFEPFHLGEFEHMATVCIGISAFMGDEGEDGDLLKQADLALYQAKAVGRGVIRFYDPRLQMAVAERAALEADLRVALAHRQLLLHYQPQLHRGWFQRSRASTPSSLPSRCNCGW